MRLAEKTELALVWRNPAVADGSDRRIGVVKSASEIGKQLLEQGNQASHVDPKTRSQFFAFERPLYWEHKGQDVAKPDALVFGFAELDRKSRTMSLELGAFTKGNPEQEFTSDPVTVKLDQSDLMECGIGINVRHVKTSSASLLDSDSPLELQIYYGDEVATAGNEKNVQWNAEPQAMKSVVNMDTVSYTHLTLPTICSV